jgi:hypothetical protein
MINITPFMEMMKLAVYLPSSKKIIEGSAVLCDRGNKISGSEHEEPTLKALEAFKRVRQIKKVSEESMKVTVVEQEKQEAQIDRENLLQMLTHDNYNELINRYQIERDPHLSSLSLKLD